MQFEKIDSKIDLLKSEVKERIESVEHSVEEVRANVSKVEERHKQTEIKLGIADGGPGLAEMREYLEYNKQFNINEEKKRIENKSKKELDHIIELKQKMTHRKRNSKSAEKSSVLNGAKRLKLGMRESFKQGDYTTIETENVNRYSLQQINQSNDGRNKFKIPPIKTNHKKFTPKHLGNNVDFVSLEAIEKHNYY